MVPHPPSIARAHHFFLNRTFFLRIICKLLICYHLSFLSSLKLVALHKCKEITLLAADGQGAVVTTHSRDTSEQARRGQEPQSGYHVGETEDSPFSSSQENTRFNQLFCLVLEPKIPSTQNAGEVRVTQGSGDLVLGLKRNLEKAQSPRLLQGAVGTSGQSRTQGQEPVGRD